MAYLTLLFMLPCFFAAVYIFSIGVTDKTVSGSMTHMIDQ